MKKFLAICALLSGAAVADAQCPSCPPARPVEPSITSNDGNFRTPLRGLLSKLFRRR